MSKYYTINTSNAFGALDLDSDDGEVVLHTPPKVDEPTPVVPVAAASPSRDNKRDNRRGNGPNNNRRGDNNRRGPPRERDNVATGEGAEGETSAGAEKDTRRVDRKQGGDRPPRRGGRDFQPREGKRTFDRRGGTAKPKEDTDATHHLEDENAAEAPTTDALPAADAEAVETTPAEPVEVRIAVQDYLKEQEANRVEKVTGSVPEEVLSQVAKEIADQGLKPIADADRDLTFYAGTANRAKKDSKKEAAAHVDLFSLVGKTAPIRQSNDNRRGDRDNNRRGDRDNRKGDQSPSTPLKKKQYKDETLFPPLA